MTANRTSQGIGKHSTTLAQVAKEDFNETWW
jgi:hypothetical protein